MTLDGITIPDDMEWVDRFRSTLLDQSIATSLSGALVVETGARLTGRPVTLSTSREGNCYAGWVTLATVKALKAVETAGRSMTLVLQDASEMVVTWRTDGGTPIEAAPVTWKQPDDDADKYFLTLRLMEI